MASDDDSDFEAKEACDENDDDDDFAVSPPKKLKLVLTATRTPAASSSRAKPVPSSCSRATTSISARTPLLSLSSLGANRASATLPRMIIPSSNSIFSAKFKPPTVKGTATLFVGSGFKQGSILGVRATVNRVLGPVHEPDEEGAIVLYTPRIMTQSELFEATKSTALGKPQPVQKVHVVVDPRLSKVLRKHQVEGVQFLYDCLTGIKKPDAFGCIMADEMGLGKTLQCITILWTLLRQSPEPGKATIEKAIIVCPSSLVKNWSNEIKKWLGPNSINPLACDNKGGREQSTKDIENFVAAKGRAITHPVVIISYESLRAYADLLKKTEIGLMMCDEGHRLKNADSQTYKALNELNAKRRVILSGTPVQNDLTEYYSLLSFAIPNILGTESEFRKNYENPIQRGRDAGATPKEKELGDEKMKELMSIVKAFIIRRTADLLTKFLPIKYEHVVFCKLSPLQLELYKSFCSSPETKKLLNGVGSQPLKAITLLKKLCNHPALGFDFFGRDAFPTNFSSKDCQQQFAGKMLLLHSMLGKIKALGDKIVLISNYTQTLDLFDLLCKQNQWGVLRLDGTMTIQKRQKLVDQFNDPLGREFVFLLSSKAGGCGINLVGANRLVLFDPDWNPANDAQALARVWRDGQKKTCFLYRFIATGSIEEKIFQRQAHKQQLSNCIVDDETETASHFSANELRQLFTLKESTACDTHDTFKCKRCIKGRQVTKPGRMSAGATANDTSNWNHFGVEDLHKMHDSVLKESAQKTKMVTFVFENECKAAEVPFQ
ncbi:SNF2 family N-terminal domain-containing protein [Chytriomyces sp. MP71]|nr:SNF2 family N-terminal domain-containing protein [Chytriomyces sp. MP71]